MKKIKRKALATAGLLAGLTAVVAATPATSAPAMNCLVKPTAVGTRDKLFKKDFSASIKLKDAKLSPSTVGYGPGENLGTEITVVDGQFHTAKANQAGKVAVAHKPTAGQGAVFLVTANAGKWRKGGVLAESFDISELNKQLGEIAKKAGCSGKITFPFKIKGHASAIEWSVESKPKKKIGNFEDVDVTVVGIYSNHDKAITFMVPGYSLHAHAFIPAKGVTGHIRDISLDEGAVLYVPAAN